MERLIRALIGFIWGLAICAVLTLLFGCSTARTIETPVYIERTAHDTIRSVTWRSDTLIVKDTVRMAGDTVYHSVWRDRVRVIRDTLSTTRVDTIPRVTTVTKTVTEYRLPWYAKVACVLIGVGIIVLVVLLIVKQYSKGE